MSSSQRFRVRLAATLLLPWLAGCVSLSALRERRYDEVTIEQLEKAASAEDDEALQGLIGMVERRLDDPDAVDLDLVLEALTSLGGRDSTAAFDVVWRSAVADPSEEVRYIATENLARFGYVRVPVTLDAIAKTDASALVRSRAAELAASVSNARTH